MSTRINKTIEYGKSEIPAFEVPETPKDRVPDK